uniref:Uncharacterized protein n=1 Tax=viral metagenome TaxID=1070528 RepID=A0A6C0AHY6_9ZZZZ
MWAALRYEQNQAYEESLLQDSKKTKPDKVAEIAEEPDQKLTKAELREKRIQTLSGKKT